jgi:hypothetical protein
MPIEPVDVAGACAEVLAERCISAEGRLGGHHGHGTMVRECLVEQLDTTPDAAHGRGRVEGRANLVQQH